MTKSINEEEREIYLELAHQLDRISRQLDIGMHTGSGDLPIEGIGAVATMVMQRLDQIAPTSVGQLVLDMRRNASQITRAIAHLEQHEFITRTPSPDDARIFILDITPKGREYLTHTNWLLARESSRIFGCLPDTDRDMLLALMRRIVGSMDAPD